LIGAAACRSSQQNLNRPLDNSNQAATNANANTAPSPPPEFIKKAVFVQPGKKSIFDHNISGHKEINCITCHNRTLPDPVTKAPQDPKDPEPKFPGHAACDDCHDKENYGQSGLGTLDKNPFCATCHSGEIVGVTPDQRPRPALINFTDKQSEFGLRGGTKGFLHKTHMDPQKMSGQEQPARCDVCHKFDSRGAQSSFPGHAECYSCHIHQAGQKFGACDVCHTEAKQAVKYSPGMGTALRLYNFRHSSSHLKAATCDRCHKLLDPGDEARLDVTQISTGRGQRHTSACWSCHKQARETACFKCHTGSLPFN
ncbi:MAG TPA: cytochrome c3 family protein, partial [Blastocatellia bacterium]|nr:cytochrome c3 family protein [Blastocatellia bacterium]